MKRANQICIPAFWKAVRQQVVGNGRSVPAVAVSLAMSTKTLATWAMRVRRDEAPTKASTRGKPVSKLAVERKRQAPETKLPGDGKGPATLLRCALDGSSLGSESVGGSPQLVGLSRSNVMRPLPIASQPESSFIIWDEFNGHARQTAAIRPLQAHCPLRAAPAGSPPD